MEFKGHVKQKLFADLLKTIIRRSWDIVMTLIFYKHLTPFDLPMGFAADTHILALKINSVAECANELIELIKNTSWIDKLNSIGKATYESKAQETRNLLVEMFERGSGAGTITAELGEYAVSITAGNGLGNKLNHTVFPMAELWKEKVINNPGFDFHTESPSNHIAFGESKFRSEGNPYSEAAKQANKFLERKKDLGDAGDLERLSASAAALSNLISKKRGVCIAFSMNSKNHEEILLTAIKSNEVQKLGKQCKELFVVGVKHVS